MIYNVKELCRFVRVEKGKPKRDWWNDKELRRSGKRRRGRMC